MADVVQTLTIDASGATTGAAEYSAAMDKVASSAAGMASSVDQKASAAIDKMSVSMNGGQGTVTTLTRQIDALQARVDPAANAWKTYSSAVTLTDAAVAKHVITSQQQTVLLDQVTNKLKGAGDGTGNYSKQLAVMQGQLVAVAGNLGITGVLLAGMGPIGLATAVALGAASAAFSYLSAEADRMGDLSLQLKNISESTDLTTNEMQALTLAGAAVGETGEQVANTFTRFSVAVAQLRQGTGPLFTDLEKINPALVAQLSTTTSTADAWNLLAAAYVNVDKAQQAQIARAVGSKGNISGTSNLLTSTANVGGIGGLQAGMQSVDLITQAQIQHWATLKVEIDEATKLAQNNLASIYTDAELQRQSNYAKSFLQFSQAAKEFTISGDLGKLLNTQPGQNFLGMLTSEGGMSLYVPNVAAPSPKDAATSRLAQGLAVGVNNNQQLNSAWRPAADDALPSAGSPQVIAAQTAALMTALGPAATASDKLQASLQKLDAEYANNAFGAKGSADAQANYNKAVAAVTLDAAIANTAAYVSALGVLASVQDTVNAKMGAVAKTQQQFNVLTPDQVQAIRNLTQANAEWAQVSAQSTAGVFDLGAATKAAGDELQSWIDRKLIDPTNAQQMANAHDILAAKIQQTKTAAQDANPQLKAMADLSFQQLTSGMDSASAAAANMSHQLNGSDWAAHINDAAPQMAAFNDQLKQAQNYASNFATTFATAMAQGKTSAEALKGAIGGLGTSMMNSGIKDITNSVMNGQMPSTTSIATAGVGYLLSSYTAAQQKAQAAQDAWDQANAAWAAMAGQVEQFSKTLTDTVGGTLTQGLAQAQTQAQTFADAAHKAGQEVDQLNAQLAQFADTQIREFIASFDVMVEALNQGLGPDSPAVKAAANVQQLGETLQAFITDTQTTITATGASPEALGVAQQAAQAYALSLLQATPTLSDVATKLLTLRGTAQQLGVTLENLGMSSTDAAAAIAGGLSAALAKIKSDFASGLQASINTANGQGYINDLNTLITQSLSNLSDAQSLGVDPNFVAQAFQSQAQAIVDGAGLVGSSFNDLITQFPELAGVITQSSTALTTFADNIAAFLTQLQTGSLSDLSPGDQLAAAQSAYSSQLALAQSGDPTAMSGITGTAQTLLTAAQGYFASSTNYAAIFDQVSNDLSALPGGIESVNKNTNSTAQTLGILQDLQAATSQTSANISDSVTNLGLVTQNIASNSDSQYFAPMVNYLAQIAAWTQTSGSAASAPGSVSSAGMGFLGAALGIAALFLFKDGGVVPGYASGGVVGNGTYDVDSVRAKYAGGGDIMLAGGEGIITAPATQAIGGEPTIDYINTNNRLPAMSGFAAGGVAAGLPSSSSNSQAIAANDNRKNFADLAQSIAMGHSAIIARLARLENAYLEGSKQVADATRTAAARKPKPGTRAA